MGGPAAEWPCPRVRYHVSRSLGCCVKNGTQVRNELTMYGRVGTLADDLIRPPHMIQEVLAPGEPSLLEEAMCACVRRWSDGSVWARCDIDAAGQQFSMKLPDAR